MSASTVTLPDSLYGHLKKLAEQQNITVDQFVATAVAEKMSAVDKEGYIAMRAKRADENAYRDALARIPDAEPQEHDKL